MRFKRGTRIKAGDKRFIIKFLWLPMTINGETRWLEFASIQQKAVKRTYVVLEGSPDSSVEYIGYVNTYWRK